MCLFYISIFFLFYNFSALRSSVLYFVCIVCSLFQKPIRGLGGRECCKLVIQYSRLMSIQFSNQGISTDKTTSCQGTIRQLTRQHLVRGLSDQTTSIKWTVRQHNFQLRDCQTRQHLLKGLSDKTTYIKGTVRYNTTYIKGSVRQDNVYLRYCQIRQLLVKGLSNK